MIVPLIKRDIAWKATPWFAAAVALAWARPSITGAGAMIALMALVLAAPQRRATRFEAALPISGRDLIAARTLSMLAVIWIPAVVACAAIIVLRGFSAQSVRPLAAGAICTLIGAVVQLPRRRLLEGPWWLIYCIFPFFPLVVSWTIPLIPVLCGVAGIALLAGTWFAAPAAFQIHGERVQAGEPARQAGGPARIACVPVLRSAYSWQYFVFVGFIGMQTIGGQWLLSCFWLVFVWQTSRMRTRWLWALPVSKRALLWAIIGPLLAAQFLGWLAERHGERSLVSLGAVLLWSMLNFLFLAFIDWRHLPAIPRRVRQWAYLSLIGALFLAHFVTPWNGKVPPQILARFTDHAPVTLAAMAAAILALSYFTERMFGEPDFADKPKTTEAQGFGS